MLAFLAENNKWIDFSAEELYEFSFEIASNPSKSHDARLTKITTTIKKHLVDF